MAKSGRKLHSSPRASAGETSVSFWVHPWLLSFKTHLRKIACLLRRMRNAHAIILHSQRNQQSSSSRALNAPTSCLRPRLTHHFQLPHSHPGCILPSPRHFLSSPSSFTHSIFPFKSFKIFLISFHRSHFIFKSFNFTPQTVAYPRICF